MASEKHDFKPPKPRTYSGKGKDKDPETLEQWKQEVLDYFDLTSMPPSKHIQAIGYFETIQQGIITIPREQNTASLRYQSSNSG